MRPPPGPENVTSSARRWFPRFSSPLPAPERSRSGREADRGLRISPPPSPKIEEFPLQEWEHGRRKRRTLISKIDYTGPATPSAAASSASAASGAAATSADDLVLDDAEVGGKGPAAAAAAAETAGGASALALGADARDALGLSPPPAATPHPRQPPPPSPPPTPASSAEEAPALQPVTRPAPRPSEQQLAATVVTGDDLILM